MKKFKLWNNLLGCAVFLIATIVYLMTMEPTASFWDCGEFISSAFKMEVGHPPGAPFFMILANLFTQFAPDTAHVALMVNSMSALCSGLTILFLFWTITHLARKIMMNGKSEMSLSTTITILGSGAVGALVYTFSDTFWFSAVEGEVYACSSLFTAVVFWLILKWEDMADQPHADRWILLIAYLTGLSVGVHLLNLLCIPACVLVYYFKKYDHPSFKGSLVALALSFVMIIAMMYGVVQGLVEVCGLFELLFVNVLGLPYNTGVIIYVIVLLGVIIWGIYETQREVERPIPLRLSFLLSIILIGIPFLGDGYLIGAIIILALAIFLYVWKKANVQVMNTILVSLLLIVIGYSSYTLTLVRATADTPMNQNNPKDIFTLRTYLAREQYGRTPLLYGNTYVSEIARQVDPNGQTCSMITKEGAPTWSRITKNKATDKDHYYISRHETEYTYVDQLNMLFPRMYSTQGSHIESYKEWAEVEGTPVTFDRCGKSVTVIKPTFIENLRFFFRYQLSFMYGRYFMWNFSGRQNDIQGNGSVLNGNWITGIPVIDNVLVGPSTDMPYSISHNKGHNVYYMLPFLLGLLGIFYQAYAGKKGVQSLYVTFMLFFMTGIAIVLYLNQTPYQPRERDYAYAGSFYAFSIWVGFGVAGLARLLEDKAKLKGVMAASLATLAALLVPLKMAAENWDDHDRSKRYVCRDFGSNYLNSCKKDAILFTNGDNDTFPLWYAQEVEGIRTDVRVCNTSYLQTDWYIDQMKKQAYDSKPLPISWDHDEYKQGTRDAAYIFKLTDDSIKLKTALDFVRSNDPKFKKIPGVSEPLDYIPSETVEYEVDSAAAIQNGVVKPKDAAYILPSMKIDLKGKNALGKQELIILNMLQTNNWKRPIYYSITVSSDQWCKLDPYFQQTGLANEIVPMHVKGTIADVNIDEMYDNVMHKFKWGGINKSGIYIDENTMRMCKTYRSAVFNKLASSLIANHDTKRALEVLDKCTQILPPENVPYDASALATAELYFRLDQKQKAEAIYKEIADDALRTINWMFRLTPNQLHSVFSDLRQNLAILQDVLRVTKKYDPDFAKPYEEEFNTFIRAFKSTAEQ